MKKILIITSIGLFSLLAAFNAGAQSSATAEAKPLARPVSDANATKTDLKKPMPNEGMESGKPITLQLQMSEQPKVVAAPDPLIVKPEEVKAIEITANSKKGMPAKNIDRPKVSTIQPESKVAPQPVIAPKILTPTKE